MQNSCATAAAVAAKQLNKPVRLWLNLEDNMKMLGKRNPYLFDYQVFHVFLRAINIDFSK